MSWVIFPCVHVFFANQIFSRGSWYVFFDTHKRNTRFAGQILLLGGAMCPSWKILQFVNGKDDIPYVKWKIKAMFQTTNQVVMYIFNIITTIIIQNIDSLHMIINYYMNIIKHIRSTWTSSVEATKPPLDRRCWVPEDAPWLDALRWMDWYGWKTPLKWI
jgi:hypothetical protein